MDAKKALLEAALAKAAERKATAEGNAKTSKQMLLERALQKAAEKGIQPKNAKAPSASPTAAVEPPSPAPLPRLKGDVRPVEPVAGVSAVAPEAAAPAPDVPEAPGILDTAASYVPKGLSDMFQTARLLNPVTAPAAIGTAIGQGFGKIGTTPFEKSYQTARRDLEAGKAIAGVGDAKALAREEKELRDIQYEGDLQKRIKEYGEAPWYAAPGYLMNNPDVFAALMGEQSANAAISIGAGVAGAGVGSLAGPGGTVGGLASGVMLSSTATRTAEAVSEYMQDKGIDPTNEEQLKGLFANPAAMSEMRSYALKTGIPVGMIDGFFALVGAKGVGGAIAKPFVAPFVKPVEKMVNGQIIKQVVPGPIAEGAANLAMNTVGSGSGEALGQLWSRGTVNLKDVADEVIFGVAADLGTSTVSTIVARGERNSRAPTAEELAAAGIMTNPEDVIVTPEEAIAEGRTLFGYAVNDSQDPVEVGTYEEAEQKAGAGDIRRGKIIAVKEDEADIETSFDIAKADIENELKDISDPQNTKLGIGQAVSNFFQRNGVEFSKRKRVFELLDVLPARIAVEGPAQITQELYSELQKLELPSSRKAKYSGDRKGRGVSPRVRNAIPIDSFEASFRGVKPASGLRKQTSFIDGDKLQGELQARGWKVVPANIKRIVAGNARMEKLLDTTFTFTTPAARQRFIDGNIDDRVTLMKSGDVQWAGKLDGRFFPSNELGLSADERRITFLKEDGTEVDPNEAADVLNNMRELGLGTNAMESKWQWGERQYSSDVDRADIVPEFEQLVGSAKGSSKILSQTSGFKKFADLFARWHKQFRIQKPTLYIELVRNSYTSVTWPAELQMYPKLKALLDSNSQGYNGMAWDLSENARIVVLVTDAPNPLLGQRSDSELYSTMTHEMGHVISSEHFANAPLEVRNKVFAAYRRFILANPLTPQVYEQFKRRRFAQGKQTYDFSQTSSSADYFLSFEEWFAEQTARWADTNSRPLGVLGRFFRALAKEIIKLYKSARQADGKLESRAELEMDQYLSAIWDGADVLTNWPEHAVRYTEKEARTKSAKVDPDPLSQHGSTANVSAVLKSVENQPFMSPAQKSLLGAVRAGVDRYNWFYEWALNLRQLAARNPHIQELQLVNEIFDFAKNDATRIMVEAEGYLKRWRRRSTKQQDALTALLFEMDEMSYLQPNEQPRWPTPQEFSAMVTRLGLDADTLALYKDLRDFFLNSVRRQEELQIQEAMRITDPALQQAAIKSAQDMSRNLISRPYFPQMRFGKWSLTVRQPQTGKLEHFELFESKRELQAALKRAADAYPESAGWSVEGSTVPQEMQPFMGVPPWMLDKLRDMPGLTKDQQDWMESFRYMLAPAQSFRKRLMKRKNYSGFSTDGRRVFANYSFHHARFYSRIKHDWDLRQAIDSLRGSRNPGLGPMDISDRKRMADFVERIYKEFRNPSQDWAALRVLNAIWHLGFVPASAVVNLTQTVLATAPYLSAKFGSVKGEAALMNAARKLSTYYKQGSYKAMSGDEWKAIAKAVEDGHIDESMAAELAASAVGSGAGLRVGSSLTREKLGQGWQFFSDKAMWMFRMAEQWNRRVSFRAARQLAYDNPTTQWVQDMRIKHFLKYDQLMKAGWTDREALAYLAGIETLLETHYTYDRLARPRFMQGKKSVLFAFYMFTQNSLFMLWNNKDMMARYMLYMAMIAGPMGLVPDDAEEVLNAIARKLFGKDFNLEREARKLIVDLLDDESAVPPDLLLHGISRYSFGLSLAGDTLGAKFVPEVDMSKSMTISRVLPLNVTSLLKPAADWNEMVANVTRDAAGAAFGIPLAITKAIAGSDLDLTDFKRWESAMPRAFRQATRATRYAIEGGERNNQMAQTIPYDYEDPKQLGELLAIAAGFTPTRQSQFWDQQMAEKELDLFWTAQKTMLYEELYQSKFIYNDKAAFSEGMDKVREYNKRAPKGYHITTEALKNSLKRRETTRRQVESGDNPYAGPGVEAEINRLYPEGEITQQKKVK